MNNNLERLFKVLPRPNRPTNAIGDWARVESELGFALPDDYKMFISSYGTGTIDNDFFVYNYLHEVQIAWEKAEFVKQLNKSVYNELSRVAEMLGEDKGSIKHQVPHPFYPSEGGLLPWGGEGAWSFWWITEGAPNSWTVAAIYKDVESCSIIPNASWVDFLLSLFQLPAHGGRKMRPVFRSE